MKGFIPMIFELTRPNELEPTIDMRVFKYEHHEYIELVSKAQSFTSLFSALLYLSRQGVMGLRRAYNDVTSTSYHFSE